MSAWGKMIDINFSAKQLVSLCHPVVVCMLFVSVSLGNLRSWKNHLADDKLHQLMTDSLPFDDDRFVHSIGNFIGIFCWPVVILFLLAFNCCRPLEKHLNTLVLIQSTAFLCLSIGYYAREVLDTLEVVIQPWLLWTISVASGLTGTFTSRLDGFKQLQRLIQLFHCGFVAMIFLRLPQTLVNWTLILLPFYDLFAVISTAGPIRRLAERQFDDSLVDAVVYTTTVFKTNSSHHQRCHNHRSTEVEYEGLGDIIFFSVLTGMSQLHGDLMTTVSTAIAILFGLLLTAIRMEVTGRTVPALPVSILLGLGFYSGFHYFVRPYAEDLHLIGAIL